MNWREIVNKISWNSYEQYDAGWCKVEPFDDMAGIYQEEQTIIDRYLKEPENREHIIAAIRTFLEHSLICYTPERFMYLQYVDTPWMEIDQDQFQIVVAEIANYSLEHIEQQKREAEEQVHEILGWFELESIEAYEALPKERQQEIDLPDCFNNYGLDPDGKPGLDFTDYPLLQKQFCDQLFDPESVTCWCSVPPEKMAETIKNREILAVIGIDREKIGILWLEY